MARQRLGWQFAVVLFVATATFVAAVWIVRHWQRSVLPLHQTAGSPMSGQ